MPVKIARSAARPSFGLPELLVAIHTSRQSCSEAGKARIFALVWESSGESRLNAIRKLRKQGVGINKIARKLGTGVSVVQRIVAEASA